MRNNYKPDIVRYPQPAHTGSMTYEIGTHIDLSFINKPQPSGLADQFAPPRPERRLFLPGTQFRFVEDLTSPPQIILPAV